jgi:hypothetical protein
MEAGKLRQVEMGAGAAQMQCVPSIVVLRSLTERLG